MAWVFADRVLDTSVTAGTGALTLSGTSPLGWRTFSTACAVGDAFYYTIYDPITGAWETGEGTYSAANTVTRSTVRASTNAGALVSFAANAKSVFIDVIGYYFANKVGIGGPFLPLAGGTLTGALTGTTATFNGSVDAGTNGGSNRFSVHGTDAVDSFIVLNSSGGKFFTVKPEALTDTTAMGYWTGSTWGTLLLGGPLTGTTATFATSAQAGGSGTGSAKLNSGGTNAGYIEFDKADGTRVGYIGLFTDRLVYNADVGYHDFVGSLNTNGTLTGTTATFSSTVNANVAVKAGASGYGAAALNNGSTTNSGYLEIRDPDNSRVGYIGYLTDRLNYNAEIGYHEFNVSSVAKLSVTGTGITVIGTAGVSQSLEVRGTDSNWLGFFAGTTQALRIVSSASGISMQGVDITGVTSYQPLALMGSRVDAPTPAPGTNDTQIATTAFVATAVGTATNKLLQTVSVETGALATGTTQIPFDDTIPQITEGDQYMTLAITPKSATSRLIIEVVLVASSSVTNNLIVALFQDATANALAVTTTTMPTGTSPVTGSLRHAMTSGTTSSTTFRVRAGGNNAGTTTFNGNSGNRNFGGVLASSIVIQEVVP
jgi:hypothetical protein